MADNFKHVKSSKEQPAENAYPVTYTDGVFTPPETGRAIYVGVTGDIVVRLVGNPSVSRTFKGAVAGSTIPIRVASIIQSGTTATDILLLV
jgi:hypothetical protein